MKLTKTQKELMKHTISDPNRNWFATTDDSEDSIEFEKLVKNGFATSQPAALWMGDDVIYMLTQKGKEALLARTIQ